MQTVKLPYEVLIRFDQDGAVQGAHVIWAFKVMSDDGSVVAYQSGGAEDAGDPTSKFPLSGAVSDAIIAAFQDRTKLLADHAAELKAAATALQAAQEEAANQIADVMAQYQAKIDALQVQSADVARE